MLFSVHVVIFYFVNGAFVNDKLIVFAPSLVTDRGVCCLFAQNIMKSYQSSTNSEKKHDALFCQQKNQTGISFNYLMFNSECCMNDHVQTKAATYFPQ